MAQQQAVHKFVLGNKELEGKVAEFQYDKGWYSITDIVGEERNVIYKSRNAQEAYMKWNVYIGRKKERVIPDDRRKANQEKNEQGNRPQRENHETSDRSENENNGRHDNYRRRRRDNRRDRQVQEQE